MKTVTKILIFALPVFMAAGIYATPNNLSSSNQQNQAKTGYEIDGRTSASVIAAKRSHTVADRDEKGLAIYSGIFVVGLIIFLTQSVFKK
ncbi:MAG: hypothetical protein ABSB19_05305 [Methylomonas sp.]